MFIEVAYFQYVNKSSGSSSGDIRTSGTELESPSPHPSQLLVPVFPSHPLLILAAVLFVVASLLLML